MNQTRFGLGHIIDDRVDTKNIPIEELFELLKCNKEEGLSTAEGQYRISIIPSNKLQEKKENKFLKFLGFMWDPISWLMELAAVIAIVLANGGGKPPDWQVFFGIIMLLAFNSTISFIIENVAGNTAEALIAGLAPKAKVLRDGSWSEQDPAILVPGDIISIKSGDIVPADARLLEGEPLKIDQSAITGESLRVTKNPGDVVYSGSTCMQGEIKAIVTETGIYSRRGKGFHIVERMNQAGHFQKVLTAIGNFCICFIAIGIVVVIVMYPIQHRLYRNLIDNILVLLIGGIPIAMPTIISVTVARGFRTLMQQGAIVKRMVAIEKLAGMDVLCSDKTGTLTLKSLIVDKPLVEVFAEGLDKDQVIRLAARASRTENQGVDSAIIRALLHPDEARDGIKEVHFLPFNPIEKRTALTYVHDDGNWHRASKGAPEQILDLCNAPQNIKKRVHIVIDKYANLGLESLAVARQEVPEKTTEASGGPWQFVGLLPLFNLARNGSAKTIARALQLGVNVKMITGDDQIDIAKVTARKLGMGINMYPTSSLLGQNRDASVSELPVDELIEKADGFIGVFPEHRYEIVKRLQDKKHICGMTGEGVNDAPALKKADIGIAVDDATDAARSAADIILTQPGLSVIVSAVLTSRAICQTIKNYTIYAVSITVQIVLGFTLIALIWKFNLSPFITLIIAILNNGIIMMISTDRVKPSPKPFRWKLKEIFATGTIFGSYLALATVFFFWVMRDSDKFSAIFHVRSIRHNNDELMAALYLQVSIMSQAHIFITQSRSWCILQHPGWPLVGAFLIAQLIAAFIAVYADWGFARIKGVGWGWAGLIWIYNIIVFGLLDLLKFAIRYIRSGRDWDNLLNRRTPFTATDEYGRAKREAQWAATQTSSGRRLLGAPQISNLFPADVSSEITEQAKKRAEIARSMYRLTMKPYGPLRLPNFSNENGQPSTA